MHRLLILVLALLVTSRVCHAQRAFEQGGIIMLQTEKLFFERVPGMGAFEVYVKQLVDAVNAAVANLPRSKPANGFLVVAVKPGGRSRVWLDSGPQLSDEAAQAIKTAAQQVYPVLVKNGVVLFAIKVSLWGAEPPKGMVPRPKEWEAEAEKAGGEIELGDLVLRVWPD